MPDLSNKGKAKKKIRDGRTSQKMLDDKALIFDISCVSRYSHNMARTDTIGTDAKIAPTNELRLETSETSTTSSVVILIFNM